LFAAGRAGDDRCTWFPHDPESLDRFFCEPGGHTDVDGKRTFAATQPKTLHFFVFFVFFVVNIPYSPKTSLIGAGSAATPRC